MTPADVQRVAKQYLNGGRVRLVIDAAAGGRGRAAGGRPHAAARPRPLARTSGRRCRSACKLRRRLDLLVVEKREVPTVALRRLLPRWRRARPGRTAPAWPSFTARLLTEGTKTRSSTQIAEESDFIAARPNVGVDRENVIVSTEALTRHWPAALELLADVIAQPDLPARPRSSASAASASRTCAACKDDPNAIADRVEPTGCSTAARRRTGTPSAVARRRSKR